MRTLFLCLFLFTATAIHAQHIYVPVNHFYNHEVLQQLNQNNRRIHTASKPLVSSITGFYRDDLEHALKIKENRSTWIGRKLKSENLVQLEKENFFLTVDPLMDLSYGEDPFTSYRPYTNMRGIIFSGEVNNKVYFFTSFNENQVFYPSYLSNFVDERNVAPGSGRIKPFKTDGFDFAMASAMVAFDIGEQFNVQLGHHKNFIGEGYRSLFLSDNAFNYPHLKLSWMSKNGKWLYQTIHASLSTLNRLPFTGSTEAQFVRQLGSFHFLNYHPFKKLSIGLFEGITWQRRNSAGEQRPFDWNFVNPLIFFNSAVNGFDTHFTNNQLGLNIKVKPFNDHLLYGQYLIGDFENSSTGHQLGYKWFDVFGIDQLHIQAEWNRVDFTAYTAQNGANYAHYNQNLAFVPVAANEEILARGYFELADFFVSGGYSYATANLTSQGRQYLDGEVGYMVNPLTGLKVSAGLRKRTDTFSNFGQYGNAEWVFLRLSTSLHQPYFDF